MLKLKSQPNVKKSSTGAPAQHNQSSRKGKRAWRKNVYIEDVEEGLEGMRVEERVTGLILPSFFNIHFAYLGMKDGAAKNEGR
jgi:nucleolar protein 53